MANLVGVLLAMLIKLLYNSKKIEVITIDISIAKNNLYFSYLAIKIK